MVTVQMTGNWSLKTASACYISCYITYSNFLFSGKYRKYKKYRKYQKYDIFDIFDIFDILIFSKYHAIFQP